MLELAHIHPGELVYDLGCGDGRILITAVLNITRGPLGSNFPKLVLSANDTIRAPGVFRIRSPSARAICSR